MRTLILGDVHLGSPLCRASQLAAVLDDVPFDRLILNGDIFDDLNLRRFAEKHWIVLDRIRKLAESREVVWIQGNHDGPPAFHGRLMGYKVLDNYVFDYRGHKVLVAHGDEFDDFQKNVKSLKRLKKLRNAFYGFAIWFDAPRKAALSWAQRSTRVFERAAEKVKHKAVQKALKEGASFVVVGHTHRRQTDVVSGVTYLNPSSWLTKNPAYVLFDDDSPVPQMVVCGAKKRPTIARNVRARVQRARRTIAKRIRTREKGGPGAREG